MQNPNRQITAAELLVSLDAAFPPLGLDGGISITQALLEDDWQNDDVERMALAYKQDVTGDWRDVTDATLEACFASFSLFPYLDDKGFVFYLPAALRYALRHKYSECRFYTLLALLPATCAADVHAAAELERIWRLLTPVQGRNVAKCIAFMAAREPELMRRHPSATRQLQCWQERFDPD